MSSTLLKYDMFLSMMNPSVNESYGADEILLESRNNGVRIVDCLQSVSINEDLEMNLLTEEEKWDIENKMWEGAHFYATNSPQLFEGFWKNFIGGVKNLSKKALQMAKTILTGIGKVIKALGQYVLSFIKAVKAKAVAAAKSTWSAIKGPIDKKFEGKMGQYTEEEMEKEGDEWGETVDWIKGEGTDKGVAMGAKDAAEVGGEIESMDKAEKDEMLKQIADKEKAAKESKQSHLDRAVTRTINEIRSSKSFDHSGLVEYAMVYEEIDQFYRSELGVNEYEEYDRSKISELNEGKLLNFVTGKGWNSDKELAAKERTEKRVSDAEPPNVEGSAPAAQAEKKKSIFKRFKDGFTLMSIVQILVSGVVAIFEKLAEFIFKKAFSKVSAWVKGAGGPGVFTFVCISGILAVAVGLIAEFGLETLSKFTGVEELETIAKGLHAMNPSYWIEKGVNLVVPGLGTALGIIAKIVCLGLAVKHVVHVFSHNRGEIDHEEGMKIDKDAIAEIDKELEKEDNSEETKEFLNDQKSIREEKIKLHKKLKHTEHELHVMDEEIDKIKELMFDPVSMDDDELKKLEDKLKEKKDSRKSYKEEKNQLRKELKGLSKEFKDLKQKFQKDSGPDYQNLAAMR